jgi:Inner membrane component of T3SS, cytoplasmic domain
MSFRLFIYYCALCGGWAAFVAWFIGLRLSPINELGKAGIRGMWLGMMIAFGLGLVDALWNLAITRVLQIALRVGVGVLVGCLAGLLGGVLGQGLYSLTHWEIFYIFGWTLTGLLVGSSIGVYELLASAVLQKEFSGSLKKLVKALVGGTVGGLLGGILSLLLKMVFGSLFAGKDVNDLWGPTAWGFVAVGMCIGLLIGLAQVILKEAWIKVEKGRRAGRELILTRERTTVGRAESCDIGLFGDNQIEKLHACILQAGNRYYVEDQQTPGGTFINEQPVVGRMPLQSGDRIRLGGNVLCFQERTKR